MKSRLLSIVFFLLIFSCLDAELFAFGKKEAESVPPVNTEWILCVTAPDVSGLPLTRQITGDNVARNLVRDLQHLSFRKRGGEEAAYYEDYAWVTARAAAAKAISTKRAERDLLVYKGNQQWKYRKDLKAADEAILKLEEDLAKIDAASPVAEAEPLFKLAETNNNGTFPALPVEGYEYLFCKEQKIDAFLASSLSEYHGRTYLNIKMYTLYSRSFSFEDSVLFSSDDISAAFGEISGRLTEAIAAINQAGVIVYASPEDAIATIDGSYAAKDEIHDHSPGTAEVAVRSDHHVPVSLSLELNAGELAEIFINLTPMALAAFEADVPGKPGSKVFLGSQYVGETPLSLELPASGHVYISVETPEGEIGTMIYRDNQLVRGSAEFVQKDGSGIASFGTSMPASAEEKRVAKARKGFYISYGIFWFVLPTSIMVSGHAKTYMKQGDEPWRNPYYATAQVAWMTALGVTISQIVRYLYVSGRDATPIVRVPEKVIEDEMAPEKVVGKEAVVEEDLMEEKEAEE